MLSPITAPITPPSIQDSIPKLTAIAIIRTYQNVSQPCRSGDRLKRERERERERELTSIIALAICLITIFASETPSPPSSSLGPYNSSRFFASAAERPSSEFTLSSCRMSLGESVCAGRDKGWTCPFCSFFSPMSLCYSKLCSDVFYYGGFLGRLHIDRVVQGMRVHAQEGQGPNRYWLRIEDLDSRFYHAKKYLEKWAMALYLTLTRL
ncbi:hypothetical protein BDV10DRAFT_123869 [Aspergillus recurvatus]